MGMVAAACALAMLCSRQAPTRQTGAAVQPASLPAADISSCEVPKDAEVNLALALNDQLSYFDDYSWRAFAALICARKAGQRGVADPALGRDGQEARVFETFKSAWEVFHQGTVTRDFDRYEDRRYNPCPEAAPGELVLASTSKLFDDVQANSEGHPFAPLPAQNRTYVRYLTQYNPKSFRHILEVLAGSTAPFPVGSVNLKSAWVEMKNLDKNRFYVRKAWIPISSNACRQADVGLVGLHIVQKTPLRPHWIWTTFEQVDNAPDATYQCPPPGGPYTFFDSVKCGKMPDAPPPGNSPPAAPTVLFNVERTFRFIGAKTAGTNQQYQGKFAADSKWKYYELVMTQWPAKDVPAPMAGDPENTFPGAGTDSAFANTVMETFFQNQIDLSCLGCHAQTADSDFVWSIPLERLSSQDSALKLLHKTMKAAGIAMP